MQDQFKVTPSLPPEKKRKNNETMPTQEIVWQILSGSGERRDLVKKYIEEQPIPSNLFN